MCVHRGLKTALHSPVSQGPNDGGLILLPGSHKLFDGYFDEKWAEQADPEWLPGGQREKQDFVSSLGCAKVVLLTSSPSTHSNVTKLPGLRIRASNGRRCAQIQVT